MLEVLKGVCVCAHHTAREKSMLTLILHMNISFYSLLGRNKKRADLCEITLQWFCSSPQVQRGGMPKLLIQHLEASRTATFKQG